MRLIWYKKIWENWSLLETVRRRNWSMSVVETVCLCILILISLSTTAQENKPKNYTINGYVKDLRAAFLFDGFDAMTIENRVHNRLNFKWYPNDEITVGIGMRNQLIYGEFPKFYNQLIQENLALIEILNEADIAFSIPLTYGESLKPNENLLPLAGTMIDESAVVLNTHIDRFWLDWYKDKWQVRVGRQRINWSKNWVWNPNDLFNTYSFIEFDYEERPGSDAIKVAYFPENNAEIEFVFNPHKRFKEESIYGMRYTWNKWNYDFQTIASYYKEQLAFGGGFAGNIKDAGLKGELTYFVPIQEQDTLQGLVASLGVDYSFQNGLLLQAEGLYNHFGTTDSDLLSSGFSGQSLSPQNLWTHRWAIFTTVSYPINPLIQGSISSIFNPEDQSFFILPGVTFSASQDIDIYILGQITQKQALGFPFNKNFHGLINTRLKWSF